MTNIFPKNNSPTFLCFMRVKYLCSSHLQDTDQMSEMSGTNSDVLSDWLSIPASVEGEGLEEGVKQTVAQALMVTNSPDSRVSIIKQ